MERAQVGFFDPINFKVTTTINKLNKVRVRSTVAVLCTTLNKSLFTGFGDYNVLTKTKLESHVRPSER